MTSYNPEFYYGHIPGTYGDYGLVPWPAHMQPRPAQADAMPDVDLKSLFNEVAGQANVPDVVVLALNTKDRIELATTIERLINLLDALEPDADLEPSIGGFLGGGTAHDEREADYGTWCHGGDSDQEGDQAEEEPSLGAAENHPTPGWGGRLRSKDGAQIGWHMATVADGEDEHSLGWGQGSQERLHASDEREQENEHGGDVQDERHDGIDEGNDEPFLGWAERDGQGPKIGFRNDPTVQSMNGFDDGSDTCAGLDFRGDGSIQARNELRKKLGKAPLRMAPAYGEEAYRLSDGAVFRTFMMPDPDTLTILRDGVARVGRH